MCWDVRIATKFGDDPVTVDYFHYCLGPVPEQTLFLTFLDGSKLTLALDERSIMKDVPQYSCDVCGARFDVPEAEWGRVGNDLPCPACGDLQIHANGHDALCGTSLAARWFTEQKRRLLDHPDAREVESPAA
jgi:hypothetical protein